MNIVIVSDAWEPQVNGVVRTLRSVRRELEAAGHRVAMISPDLYPSLPCPTYPEIRLAVATTAAIGRRIAAAAPDAVHLATEGPLCLAARRWCLRNRVPFTTAYHTHFPDYVSARTGLPAAWVWRYIRWFHGPARSVLVSTASVRAQLRAHGLQRLSHWGRGVDLDLFSPGARALDAFAPLPRPIQLYVGRVAVEKNIEAFLRTRQPGSKVIVGDGPARAALEARYPEALFTGSLHGEALAGAYAAADVFVFPSRTDTFGLVIVEALASGTPVAAYPVSGPIDLLTREVGAMSDDLNAAIAEALGKSRAACAAYGRRFSWTSSAEQFVQALAPVPCEAVREAA